MCWPRFLPTWAKPCTASRSQPSRRTSCSLPEAGSSAPSVKARAPLIGVLAMQGAFAEPVKALETAGARTRLVRTKDDLDGLDGIVLPGGESTTMAMLLERAGMLDSVREAIRGGLATLATGAGMILLARDITDGMPGQHGLGLLDISVRRNGYGRQVDSFEAPLHIDGLNGKTFPGVFIRAPLVERTGDVHVMANYDGHPVAERPGRTLSPRFYSRPGGPLRFHREC